jgi:hypothetical protein
MSIFPGFNEHSALRSPSPMTRVLVHGLLGCVLGCLALVGCDGEPEPPPFTFTGRLIALAGRVVGADSEPIEGAAVDLVSPDFPHVASMVVASATSDGAGRFRLEPNPTGAIGHLVIRSPGSEHSYLVMVPASASGSHDLGDLHIAPDRQLLVRVDCAGPLATDGGPLPVRVRFEWLGHRLIEQQLLAPSVRASSVQRPSMPGFDMNMLRPPADARRFERLVRVPAGRHEVSVSGGCGDHSRSVEVPAEGEVEPLVLTLPPAD